MIGRAGRQLSGRGWLVTAGTVSLCNYDVCNSLVIQRSCVAVTSSRRCNESLLNLLSLLSAILFSIRNSESNTFVEINRQNQAVAYLAIYVQVIKPTFETCTDKTSGIGTDSIGVKGHLFLMVKKNARI